MAADDLVNPSISPTYEKMIWNSQPSQGFVNPANQVVSNYPVYPSISPIVRTPEEPGFGGIMGGLMNMIAQQRAQAAAKEAKQNQYRSLVNLSKELGVDADVSPDTLANLINTGYQPSQAASLLFSAHERKAAKQDALEQAAKGAEYTPDMMDLYRKAHDPSDPAAQRQAQEDLYSMGVSPAQARGMHLSLLEEQHTASSQMTQKIAQARLDIMNLNKEHKINTNGLDPIRKQKLELEVKKLEQGLANARTDEEKEALKEKYIQFATQLHEESAKRIKQTPGATGGGTAKLSLDQQDLKAQMKGLPDANRMYQFGSAHGLKLRAPGPMEGVPGAQNQYYNNVVVPAIQRQAIAAAKGQNKQKLSADQIQQLKAKFTDPAQLAAKKAELEANGFDTSGI